MWPFSSAGRENVFVLFESLIRGDTIFLRARFIVGIEFCSQSFHFLEGAETVLLQVDRSFLPSPSG